MAGRTWEEEHERNQMRLRSGVPRCEHREGDNRCPNIGHYHYEGYFPDLNRGCLCRKHREEDRAAKGY